MRHDVDTVELAAEPTDADRRLVTDLALRAKQEELAIVKATKALRAAMAAHRRTIKYDLPDALAAIGQSYFELLDGTPVELKETLHAGQLSDANPAGLAWVEEHGGRPLVRATITVEFDAENIADAEEVHEMIRRHPSANQLKSLKFERRVLWNTLTKWVGELIEDLRDPPLELLGVYRVTWAQVGKTKPKTVPITGYAER
jgi:hypothetical protein